MTALHVTLAIVGVLWTAAARPGPIHHYKVSMDPQLTTIKVRACFDGAAPPALVAPSPYAPAFIEAAGAEANPKRLSVRQLAQDGCIDYRVDAAAIANLGRLTLGRWIGNDMILAPDVWLWRPEGDQGEIDISFDLPADISVSGPWQPLQDGAYRVGHTPAHWPASVAFGRFDERQIKVPGAVLRLAVLDGTPAADVDAVETWVADAARAVAGLYGRFPVHQAQVLVIPQGEGGGKPINYGHVMRGGAGAARFFIDQHRPIEDVLADWTPTHEFTHLTLPLLKRGGHWFAEGVATYYQNVLRARSGRLSARQAWQELHEGFVRGKQMGGDSTLLEASANIYREDAYTRVYWSGAAIALLADLQLRKLSHNKQSLDSALKELADCCQPWDRAWSTRELLARLDELTGTSVFTTLYREHVLSKNFPGLAKAYADLGLEVRAGEIHLQSALYARFGEAIMQGRE